MPEVDYLTTVRVLKSTKLLLNEVKAKAFMREGIFLATYDDVIRWMIEKIDNELTNGGVNEGSVTEVC